MTENFSSLAWDTIIAFTDASRENDGNNDYAAGYLGSALAHALSDLYVHNPDMAREVVYRLDRKAREFRIDVAVRELKNQ